jgi:beta-glucosidase
MRGIWQRAGAAAWVGPWLVLAGGLAAAGAEPTTVQPAPRPDEWWQKRHAAMNERVRQGDVGLVLIGDSITQGWEGDGKEAWNKHFGPRKAVNLGIGGDRTQHVLWRLENGNLEGIAPRAAVLMIGTNNSNGNENTAEEIGAGIQAIVKKLREKLPETKVLVLAIFPRGEKPNAQREKNARASQIAAELADGKMVFYLDIGEKFLEADGTLRREIMPDLLHLNAKSYQIWAEAIEEKLAELMGEKS